MVLTGLNHITIAVSHLDRSLEFYTQVLGMVAHVRWQGGAYLSLGGVWFCLAFDHAQVEQVQAGSDYSHIALSIAETDFAAFRQKLLAAQVIEWQQNTSEGQSVYFLDPDGHKLEAHCGDLQTRLATLKHQPYAGLVWL